VPTLRLPRTRTRNGTWKIFVAGKANPGADGIDFGQVVDMSLTIDGACADS
jgi:hypothetical protein